MAALCVECDAELNLVGRVRIGRRITCPTAASNSKSSVPIPWKSTSPMMTVKNGMIWMATPLTTSWKTRTLDEFVRMEGRNDFELDLE